MCLLHSLVDVPDREWLLEQVRARVPASLLPPCTVGGAGSQVDSLDILLELDVIERPHPTSPTRHPVRS